MTSKRSSARHFYRWRARPDHNHAAIDHECGCEPSRESGQSFVTDSNGDGGVKMNCRYCNHEIPLGRYWVDKNIGDRAFWPGEQPSRWSTFK